MERGETLAIKRKDFPEILRFMRLQEDGSIDGTCAIRSQNLCPYKGDRIPQCSFCRFAFTTEKYLHNWLKEKFPEENIVLREVKIGNPDTDSFVRYRLFQISGRHSLKWIQMGYVIPFGDTNKIADLYALVVETDKNFSTSYEYQRWLAKLMKKKG